MRWCSFPKAPSTTATACCRSRARFCPRPSWRWATTAAHVTVQPVSAAYVGLHGLPMGRENRPFFAWYGDMDLVSHLWEALRPGPIDVVVAVPPLTIVRPAGARSSPPPPRPRPWRLVRALQGKCAAAASRRELIEALEAGTDDAA